VPIDRTQPAPPKRTARESSIRKNEQAAQTQYKSQHDKRKEGVEGLGQAVALVMLVRKQFADAQAVGMHAPAIAEEMASIADVNDTWGKWLDYFSMSGPYAGLVRATLPLMLQIMANHGTIPAEAGAALGVVSPKTLELAGKVEQEKVEAALLLSIQESQRETAHLRSQLITEGQSDADS
jgi:hypothetical protein